ncbi:hypothetical protein ACVIIW_006217 [Bradyrhizobium sp. USDA 4449]
MLPQSFAGCIEQQRSSRGLASFLVPQVSRTEAEYEAIPAVRDVLDIARAADSQMF